MKKFLVVMGMMMVFTACKPFKVSDPSDPSFDPMKFSFSDYHGKPQIEDALGKIFPVGTPRQEIEKVFIGAMRMEESVPWHRREKAVNESGLEGGTIITPERGEYYYNIYYFKQNTQVTKSSPTGQYVLARYTLSNTLQEPIRYGRVTLEKGQGLEVLVTMGLEKEEQK